MMLRRACCACLLLLTASLTAKWGYQTQAAYTFASQRRTLQRRVRSKLAGTATPAKALLIRLRTLRDPLILSSSVDASQVHTLHVDSHRSRPTVSHQKPKSPADQEDLQTEYKMQADDTDMQNMIHRDLPASADAKHETHQHLDVGFTFAFLGTAALLPLEAFLLLGSFVDTSHRLVHASMLPALGVTVTLLHVMRSRALRKGLSPASLKIISGSLLISFGIMAFDTFRHIARLAVGLPKDVSHARVLAICAASLFCATGFVTARTSFKTLQLANSSPRKPDQVAVQGERRKAHGLFTIWIAGGLVLLALEQAFLGAEMIFFSQYVDLGAFRCFAVAAAALTCFDAVVSGPSNMKWKPYSLLGFALAADSTVRVTIAVMLQQPFEIALAAVGAASSIFALVIGAMRSRNRPVMP